MSLAYELISVPCYRLSEKRGRHFFFFFVSSASMKELVITLALIHLKNMKASPIAT